jgi:RNA polymerase primary sigma factor
LAGAGPLFQNQNKKKPRNSRPGQREFIAILYIVRAHDGRNNTNFDHKPFNYSLRVRSTAKIIKYPSSSRADFRRAKWADAKNFLRTPLPQSTASISKDPRDYGAPRQPVFDKTPSGGSRCPATWEGANVGNVSSKVTAKVGATKSYEELVLAAENARTLNACTKTWGDLRLAGKGHCRPDATRFYAAKQDAESRVYRKPKRWRPSQFHINEATLAKRYDVKPSLLSRLRDFPLPISDFGAYPTPIGKWWHLSVLAVWERSHYRGRSISEIKSILRAQNKSRNKYAPQTTSRLLPGYPKDLVSDDARNRSKNIAPPTIRKVIFLTPGEEIALIVRAKNGNLAARNKIILAHLPLLKKIAIEYQSAKFDIDDLVQQGIAGHVSEETGKLASGIDFALQNFNVKSGFRFSTFAQRPIMWAMTNYVKRHQREISLNKFDRDGYDEGNRVVTNILSDNLIDDSTYSGDELDDQEFLDAARTKLNAKLNDLTDKERQIIETHHGLNGGPHSETLAEIGTKLNLSRERIRQIEKGALIKIGLKG